MNRDSPYSRLMSEDGYKFAICVGEIYYCKVVLMSTAITYNTTIITLTCKHLHDLHDIDVSDPSPSKPGASKLRTMMSSFARLLW